MATVLRQNIVQYRAWYNHGIRPRYNTHKHIVTCILSACFISRSAMISRFSRLRYAIEVAYIFATVKSITVEFLVWENTTRKELRPFELTSTVTTEFAF